MAGDEIYIVSSEYQFFDGEDSAIVGKQLDDLNRWLEENPKINAMKCSARNLLFLRGCKYDLEKTKKKLKSFYALKAIRKEWFWNRDPFSPDIQELLTIGVFLPLPEKDDKDRPIVVIRTAAHDPKKHSQNLVLKVSKMILDILLYMQPEVATVGIMAIFDMDGVTLGHGLQMTPMHIKKSVESWSCYPSKPKMLEFVNVPTHVNLVLNTFRFFMTSKMKSRMIVRKTTSQLNSNLPKELGGKGQSYSELALKWKRIVEQNADFFVEDEKYRSTS
ncbi:hypothetical protein ACFFRR_011632 [Megaselia abdita]